jgi:hypothetical protein
MIAGEMGSVGEAANGFRAMRAMAAIVLVALLALGVCASAARAEPLSMTFTEARANVGVQLSDAALFEAPETAPFEAQIDPGSGLIADGVLTVPDFSTFITDPVSANVTVDFEIGVITGSFNQANGAFTLSGTAGGTLTANGKTCDVAIPGVLTLSTIGSSGGASPRFGAPFTGGLAGAGAIAGQWAEMNATPVTPSDETVCTTVDQRIGGPGGIWLEQKDLVPPSAPQLTSTNPASPGSSATPRILGIAEAGSTVNVYAGPGCAGAPVASASAAGLGSPGIPVDVAEGVTAAFSATATDAADNTSACSAPISYTRVKAPAGPGGGGPPPPPPVPACIVPKLAGKTLARAKVALKRAGCKLGKVQKPKRPKGKGKRRRVLVVKSSSPHRGAKPADHKVDLKLGPKPKQARH